MDVDEDATLVPGYELKLNSYDLGVDIEQVTVGHGLDRATSSYRHEGGRVYDTVWRRQHAAPGITITLGDLKVEDTGH